MTTLYLTRHGETQWNEAGRFQGQKNSPLTDKGKLQAKWLGERLNDAKLDVIISSSSGRAIQTAEIISKISNVQVIPNDNLREINLGQWEGLYRTEIEKNYPIEFNNFWNYPHLYTPCGGETFLQLLSRLSTEIEKILLQYKDKTILIVAHAVVLKTLMVYFENKAIKDLWSGGFMKSTSLTKIEVTGASKSIIFKGDISHYKLID